ncbi:MAG: hypothetical protein ACK5P7_05330 [Bdellovibrio sp.]|jgi:hypothetical protein
MLKSTTKTLSNLLTSQGGVHLTIYLNNNGDIIDLKDQLRKRLLEAKDWLEPVMTPVQQEKFLEPINALVLDTRLLKDLKGAIGLFKNTDSFRLLGIPGSVDPSYHVASSYHVKPLLRWIQTDQDFMFLGFEKTRVHLYSGTQNSFRLIDSVLFPDLISKSLDHGEDNLKGARQQKAQVKQTLLWLNQWIAELTAQSMPALFVAGEASLTKEFFKFSTYKNLVPTALSGFFNKNEALSFARRIRNLQKSESSKKFEGALQDFEIADKQNQACSDLFEMTAAAVRGQVQKLVIADDMSLFGKVDHDSGVLTLHAHDLNHEDDCILDDLAQLVLNQGGQVVIAKQNQIPDGRPALAILNDERPQTTAHAGLHDVLQERFG